MVLIELHVKHALSELFKHQCSTHSAVLVEYLFITLLIGDLFDLHDIGCKIYCPNHPYRYPLGRVLNVSVKFGEVDSELWYCIGYSVSVEELLKLMLTNHFEGALRIHKIEQNLLEFSVKAGLVTVRVKEVEQILKFCLFFTFTKHSIHTEQILRQFFVNLYSRIEEDCFCYIRSCNVLAGCASVSCDIQLVKDIANSSNICAPLNTQQSYSFTEIFLV
jgi:hypothetical protein